MFFFSPDSTLLGYSSFVLDVTGHSGKVVDLLSSSWGPTLTNLTQRGRFGGPCLKHQTLGKTSPIGTCLHVPYEKWVSDVPPPPYLSFLTFVDYGNQNPGRCGVEEGFWTWVLPSNCENPWTWTNFSGYIQKPVMCPKSGGMHICKYFGSISRHALIL